MDQKVDLINPWNIQSLYELQFFNCPSCNFKNQSGQDFVDHAYNSHEECQEFLSNIKDDSLDGVICPWESIEKEIKAEEFYDKHDLGNTEIDESVQDEVEETKILCELCDTYFSNQTSLQKHQDSTHISITIIDDNLEMHKHKNITNDPIEPKKTLKSIDYEDKPKIDPSQQKYESKESKIHCQPCDLYFSSHSSLKEHQDSTHISISISKHSNKDEVIQKLESVTKKCLEAAEEPKKPIISAKGVPNCEKCSMYFISQESLQRHLDNNHALIMIPEKETCDVCNKEFKPKNGQSAAELLKEHKYNRHNLECKICGKLQFLSRKTLEIHIEKVHTEKTCNICNISFKRETYLRKHNKYEHEGVEKIRCRYCKHHFHTLKGKQEHETTCNGSYTCEKCAKVFKSYNNLQHHNQHVHLEHKVACDLCDKKFVNPSGLRTHVKNRHEKVKPFVCDQCGQRFGSKQTLRNHVDAIHLQLKPFSCDLCEMTFLRSGSLKLHKLNIHHTDQKKFKCNRCDKSFSKAGDLKQHIMAVHDQIKPHECPECKKAFNDKYNMRQHVKVVHQGIREHKCTMCEKDFVRKIELQRHLESIHSNL